MRDEVVAGYPIANPPERAKGPPGLSPNSPMWDPSPGELIRPLDGSAVDGCGGGLGGASAAGHFGHSVARVWCLRIMCGDHDRTRLPRYRLGPLLLASSQRRA